MSALALLSPSEAQRLTQRIKLTASTVRDSLFKLRNLVDEAQASNAWQMLGFSSWTAYLSDTLGSEPMRLDRQQRQELVAYLSGEGMSTRAIAPIVGVDNKTVHNDIKRIAAVENSTPEPVAGIESDPADYWSPETSFVGAHPITGEVFDEPTTVTETHSVKTVTGLDGKSYSKPEPKAVKPVVIGDAAATQNAEAASREIGAAVEVLSRFGNSAHRSRILTDWWPLGKSVVPPVNRDLFNPAQLRQIADSLRQLATEMENQNV